MFHSKDLKTHIHFSPLNILQTAENQGFFESRQTVSIFPWTLILYCIAKVCNRCSKWGDNFIPHITNLLLRKSILSPKCVFLIPKSLSLGVNIRLYLYSAETETHNHFCHKSAQPFDLPGFSRQKSDCLNMKRRRKHIDTTDLFHFISSRL